MVSAKLDEAGRGMRKQKGQEDVPIVERKSETRTQG